jgi:5-methylthioribose kinase
MELLNLSEKTKEYGLVLTPNDVKTLITSRNKVLHDHARVELGIDVLKELIEVFSASPYMDQDHYVETLNKLQEIFYYLRNETEDKVGDVKLIHQMMDYSDGPCGGSLELLRSKMEELAENWI